MDRIHWSTDLEVGIGLLDAQHMNFVKLINTLGEAMEAGKDQEALSGVLEQLKLYISYHFNSEERLLRIHNYPEYEQHIREHEEFSQCIEDFALDLRTRTPGVSRALYDYLCQWFLSHLREQDQRYARFLRGKGER